MRFQRPDAGATSAFQTQNYVRPLLDQNASETIQTSSQFVQFILKLLVIRFAVKSALILVVRCHHDWDAVILTEKHAFEDVEGLGIG
jgi:hypothetical protein